jgi:hypothetical protein
MSTIIRLPRQQVDTLETDPTIHYHHLMTCHACKKPVAIKIVLLGSQADQDITQRQASPLMWNINHLFDGLLNKAPGVTEKTVRVRLKPMLIFKLRQGLSLNCSARCPHCQTSLALTLQPT